MTAPKWTHHVTEITYQLFEAPTRQRIQDELDARGAQGWELVAVEHDPAILGTRLYFKRPA
ncbi:DUF4177 domain-containing protein [Lysobacter sp. BMK333-48F3]|uniref:DUF4177 domain-containing protein n=1 Tax=Lysobacter firmicutimachus TaxID=1792846 RepID=A0AAU8MLU6_9GAMM|nr:MULTISPECIES: hypothetical protein [Lysobacter]MBX9402355.1 DUF4177 domain-containing protein [Lysobacter sp. BMK333-48F3]